MSLIFPASKKKVSVVMIGSVTHAPSFGDLEEISNWVKDHKDLWPESFKEMSSLFGYDFTFKVWPAMVNEHEYVWLVENLPYEDEEGTKTWRELFDTINAEYESKNGEDYVIFAA